MQELIGSTVEELSLRKGIGYEAVMGIVRRHVRGEMDWAESERLDQLALDEISLKKGHKDFVAIVSARIVAKVSNKPEPIFIEQVIAKVTELGRINPALSTA